VNTRPSDYPVEVELEPTTGFRNRLTVGFRLILAIPHLILVGGIGWSFWGGPGILDWGGRGWQFGIAGGGVLAAVAGVCALISWFAIVFTGNHPRGLWDLSHFYLRWRTRALAYIALLRDEYPPFGDGDYPARVLVEFPGQPRDRWSVGLRIILAIPHLIIVWALSIAWLVTSIIAWFAILFTGAYPESLYRFGSGVMRWSLRVEAYVLLLRDEYPPFSLEPAPALQPVAPAAGTAT
jgi:hypothetical protein